MEEISSTGIKTMLLKLDVKQNTDKTLTDSMRQLQSASTLKGIVTELTQEGDAIFTTNLGKFSLSNASDLNNNDKIVIEKSELSFQLISINGVEVKKPTPISLSFFANSAPNLRINKFGSSTEVIINNNNNIDEVINSNLSYANLANLNEKSLLFKLFEKAPQNAVIEFKIHKQGDIKIPNPYQVVAEIVEDKNQQQTIKTPFGILKAPTTNMSVGSRFILEIKSINNLNVDTLPLKTIVENLLFKLNTNWPILSLLFPELEDMEVMQLALKNNYLHNPNSKPSMELPTPPSMFDTKPASLVSISNDKNNPLLLNPNNNNPQSPNVSSKNINQLQQQIKSSNYKQNSTKKPGLVNSSVNPRLDEAKKITLKTPHEKEVINELKNELGNFKNSLYPAAKNENNYWHQIFWPFPKNQEIEDEQIFFKHVSKNTVRFIIEISLSEFGDIQFDGLVTLKDQDFVENFDLAVRFKNKIDKNLQSTISDIYLLNQSSTGFKGKLNFESVTEFNVKD